MTILRMYAGVGFLHVKINVSTKYDSNDTLNRTLHVVNRKSFHPSQQQLVIITNSPKRSLTFIYDRYNKDKMLLIS